MKKALSLILALVMALSLAACSSGNNAAGSASASGSAGSASQAEGGKEYKVGIVKFMDHASLDQIESSVQQELDAKSAELGVTFNYADYTFNGQGDSTTLNQIAAQLVDEVVVASPRDLGTDAFAEELGRVLGREVATDPADLFPVITHEAYLPETHDPEAPQAPRRPQREYPR